jgi:hypothetical protein
MIYIAINAGAILMATLAGMAFGAAYYRVADRNRAIGLTRNGAKLATSILLIFVAEFWFASILAGALILAPPEAGRWTMALGSAVVIWIGFVVPALIVTHRLRGMPTREAVTDCGHWLGAMIVQVVVLQSMGLQPPPG